jgi:hypothetical protein
MAGTDPENDRTFSGFFLILHCPLIEMQTLKNPES